MPELDGLEAVAADVAVIGAGPAGLSCALNLVRAGRSVVLLDANRPRHAATLLAHGYVGMDGVSPLELRARGRDEFLRYPLAAYRMVSVDSVARLEQSEAGIAFKVNASAVRGKSAGLQASVRRVVFATGLREELPNVQGLRAVYGTHVHSCVVCDGFEKLNLNLVLFGQGKDLFFRALEVLRLGETLTVLCAQQDLNEYERIKLADLGVRIADITDCEVVCDRSRMLGVRLASGEFVSATAGFVVTSSQVFLPAADSLGLDAKEHGGYASEQGFVAAAVCAAGFAQKGFGNIAAFEHTNTGVAGVFAAGEAAYGVQSQLAVAAGDGAACAATVLRSLLSEDYSGV